MGQPSVHPPAGRRAPLRGDLRRHLQEKSSAAEPVHPECESHTPSREVRPLGSPLVWAFYHKYINIQVFTGLSFSAATVVLH